MNVCRKKENPLQQNEKKKTQHDDNVMRQRETTAERQTDKRTTKTQKTTKDTKSQLEKVKIKRSGSFVGSSCFCLRVNLMWVSAHVIVFTPTVISQNISDVYSCDVLHLSAC